MFKGRLLTLLAAATLALAAPGLVAAQKDEKKRSKEEQREIEQLVKMVDSLMAGEAAPAGDVTITITPYFLKSQEQRTFVPFVLDVTGAPQADAAMYVRVVNTAEWEAAKDKKKYEYTWDDIHFVPAAQLSGSDVELHRVFMAAPGTYDVYIAMKERLPEKAPRDQQPKMGALKTTVEVPDFWTGGLSTSTVLVTDQVNQMTAPLTPEEARERPFVFGSQELLPAGDLDFRKNEELSIFFQVYNASLDQGGKPDLVMEYEFHRKEGAEEKFFNKTNPQTVNASNLPPQFDPARFPVPGGITVPLTTFPEGEYRLEIKVTDKAAGKTLTRDVNFTVKAS